MRISLGEKRALSMYQNHRWEHPVLVVLRAESQWQMVHAHFCTSRHTLAHGLHASTETHFVLPCFEEFPTQKFKQRGNFGCLFHTCSYSWDAVRKGIWKMVVLGLLQWCRCEEKQTLFLPVGWHGVNTFIWLFSLLFHYSSLGEFLLCDSMSSTRRHLASGLHSGQDRKSYLVGIQSQYGRKPSQLNFNCREVFDFSNLAFFFQQNQCSWRIPKQACLWPLSSSASPWHSFRMQNCAFGTPSSSCVKAHSPVKTLSGLLISCLYSQGTTCNFFFNFFLRIVLCFC